METPNKFDYPFILRYLSMIIFRKIVSLPMMVGISFALLENTLILVNSVEYVNYLWALIRGFLNIFKSRDVYTDYWFWYFDNKKAEEAFYTGAFDCFLIFSFSFNMFIMSEYSYIGMFMPILLYFNYVKIFS